MEAEQGAEELESLNHNRVELERLRRIESWLFPPMRYLLPEGFTLHVKYWEAMQSSDDININSTTSVKRRGKGPIVVRKTYCSFLDPSLEEHTASSLSDWFFRYHLQTQFLWLVAVVGGLQQSL
ncbi:hypothetical protein IGI04_011307 [Brassica rapa subsp. trilocularis]|uniref:Uncharacterized protein n=1 Tax=Brassica rapa subsp. trilocularis TaxID=1813537 RepID=A0ABQ7N2P9_BRACM|nr:hypothetical protein IGI04_011307 [Brassica rapa subsp. trilocularis]